MLQFGHEVSPQKVYSPQLMNPIIEKQMDHEGSDLISD
jgi:hypothetical protein